MVLGTDQRVRVYVSNATAADLGALRDRARKWLRIGVAVLAGGLAMMGTGIALAAGLAQHR